MVEILEGKYSDVLYFILFRAK